jgi:DNA-binding response OmpR family regulator
MLAKILVVEDDQLLRDLLTCILILDRHTVTVAIDGPRGILHAQRDRPDLILMDINLPFLDGMQVTQQIRAMPAMRATPIIALSAFTSEDQCMASLRAGCTLCQRKPIDFAELRQNIRVLLEGAAPNQR